MLRFAIWTLRQRRYAAMAAAMAVLAVICLLAGTWQIQRLGQTVRANDALARNAHAAAVPLSTALVPLTGQGAAPGRDAIRFRTVRAGGTFAASSQLVRSQQLDGVEGYYVLTPLNVSTPPTSAGVLLVARGFLADTSGGALPDVPPAPTGAVEVTGRLQTASAKTDATGTGGLLDSVNPTDQAARLGTPVYDAYLTLAAGQPGTAGLTAVPKPDLANPAGGAGAGQHLAYIVQWYLFALLALAAPFLIARHEIRDAQERYLGIDHDAGDFVELAGGGSDDAVAALPPGTRTGTGGELVHRQARELARAGEPTTEQWQRAERLAQRYGRSLSAGQRGSTGPVTSRPRRRVGLDPSADPSYLVGTSSAAPHRSPDAYHAAYNDYLWELALADGSPPPVSATTAVPEPPPAPTPVVIIDATPTVPPDDNAGSSTRV